MVVGVKRISCKRLRMFLAKGCPAEYILQMNDWEEVLRRKALDRTAALLRAGLKESMRRK